MTSNYFGSALAFFEGPTLRATGFFAFSFLALNFGILTNAPPSYGQRPDYTDEENQNSGEYDSQPLTVPTYTPRSPSSGGYAPPVQYSYDNYMKMGYEAEEAKNYPFALDFFNAALELQPGDMYAKRAINNVNRYIKTEQGEAAEQVRQEETKRRQHEEEVARQREQTLREEQALRDRLSQMSNKELNDRLGQLSHEHTADILGNMNTEEYSRREREIQITREVAREVCERNRAACPLYSSVWYLHPSNSSPESSIDPNFDVRNYDPLAQ